jgi:hypothetical protein
MDACEFQILMRRAVAERKTISAAEQHFQQQVAAIRAVREMSETAEPVPPSDSVRVPAIKRGDAIGRVKLEVFNMPDVFNLRELVRAVHARDLAGRNVSTKAISAAVKRLVGRYVEVQEIGTGRRGTCYRRTVKARTG